MSSTMLQPGVAIADQAFSNRGYGRLFPPRQSQWTSSDWEHPTSSGIQNDDFELSAPLSPLSSDVDTDTSDLKDDGAWFEFV